MWMNWFKVNDPTSTSLIGLSFNSVSPQFHISPREIKAHSLPFTAWPLSGARPDNQAEQCLFNFQFKFYHTCAGSVPPPIAISPKVQRLNVRVGIRGGFRARERNARGSEICSDFWFPLPLKGHLQSPRLQFASTALQRFPLIGRPSAARDKNCFWRLRIVLTFIGSETRRLNQTARQINTLHCLPGGDHE